MQTLIRVIGPAPSELPFPDLIEKVRKEHARVRAAIENFQLGVGAQKAKAKKETKPKKDADALRVINLCQEQGISLDELIAFAGREKNPT